MREQGRATELSERGNVGQTTANLSGTVGKWRPEIRCRQDSPHTEKLRKGGDTH